MTITLPVHLVHDQILSEVRGVILDIAFFVVVVCVYFLYNIFSFSFDRIPSNVFFKKNW